VPPASMMSASPRSITRYASPIACVLAAEDVVMVLFGPRR